MPRSARRRDYRLPRSKLALLRKLSPRTDKTHSKLFNLYIDITTTVLDELSAIDPETFRYERLSPVRRTVILIDHLDAEIRNGGFEQYYGNSSGDGAAQVPDALREVGQPGVARIVERANAQFPSGPPRNLRRRNAVIDDIQSKAAKAWERATTQYLKLPFPFNGFTLVAVVPFILNHESEFFKPN